MQINPRLLEFVNSPSYGENGVYVELCSIWSVVGGEYSREVDGVMYGGTGQVRLYIPSVPDPTFLISRHTFVNGITEADIVQGADVALLWTPQTLGNFEMVEKVFLGKLNVCDIIRLSSSFEPRHNSKGQPVPPSVQWERDRLYIK